MTVGQLLRDSSSVELTLWQAYLQADANYQEERRESAKKDAELSRWVNSKD